MPFQGGNLVWGHLRKQEFYTGYISLRINDLDANPMHNRILKDLTQGKMEYRRHTRIRRRHRSRPTTRDSP